MRKCKQADQMPFNFLESQKFSQRKARSDFDKGKPAYNSLLFEGGFPQVY